MYLPRKDEYSPEGLSNYLKFVFEVEAGEFQIKTFRLNFDVPGAYARWVPVRSRTHMLHAFPSLDGQLRPSDDIMGKMLAALERATSIHTKLIAEVEAT